MGELIQFQKKKDPNEIKNNLNSTHMMPDDWEDRYNPSLDELTITVKTVKELLEDHCEALSNCEPAEAPDIRYNIKRLEYLHMMLMDYYYG